MAGIGAELSDDIENPPIPLEISLKQELESLSPLPPWCCIFRVPERLRNGNPRAYTPQVVSIGPLHHGSSERLLAMEEHKKRYLQDFISRTNISLDSYVAIIRGHEQKLRNYHAETIGFNTDDFVKIILVDAAFIIMILLKYNDHGWREENDRIYNKPWMLQDVWPDLLLLENQLPFFILDKLFDNIEKQEPLVNLSFGFFHSLMQIKGTTDKLEQIRSCQIEHFVDLVRQLYVPLQKPQEPPTTKTVTSATPTCPSVTCNDRATAAEATQAQPANATATSRFTTITELYSAGVKFEVSKGDNLFDIQFHNGTLKIPKVEISDETELRIRNMVAFEQGSLRENYINDYVILMDRLVNTSEDLECLVKSGIVENRLGDNSAGATLINKLADGVVLNSKNFQYDDVCKHLDKYCTKHRNRWKANLRQIYFSTPWAGISVAAAVVIIVLTIIQTVFSGMFAI